MNLNRFAVSRGVVVWLAGMIFLALSGSPARGAEIHNWLQLSTFTYELPFPGDSFTQTTALVADFDGNQLNDFVIGMPNGSIALAWFRRYTNGWMRYTIEPGGTPVGNGAAAHDIDQDGDLDLVGLGDARSNQVWWWENPSPNFNGRVAWRRHFIKNSGKPGHSDAVFADFKSTGRPQLAFWNQGAGALLLAEIPNDPRNAPSWTTTEILPIKAPDGSLRVGKGLAVADVDADGKPDLIAGNHWLKHQGGDAFSAHRIGPFGGRVLAGQFKPGAFPQIVLAPAEGTGPLRMYECRGNPTNQAAWTAFDLLPRPVNRCHTLQTGDLNGDGFLDLFAGEMVTPGSKRPAQVAPNTRSWVLYGDGRGSFRATDFLAGFDFHDAVVADLDGDRDLDILYKPFGYGTPRLDIWLKNGTGAQWTVREQKFEGRAGLDLASLSPLIRSNATDALALARRLNFSEVETPELFGYRAADFRKKLEAAGLKCSSVVFSYEQLRNDLDGVIRDAHALGATHVVCAGLPGTNRLTRETVTKAANDLNQWSLQLRSQRLLFSCRLDGREFQPQGSLPLFEELVTRTTVGATTFAVDVARITLAGVNPAALLRRHPGRFAILYLNEVSRSGISVGAALGQGRVDYASLLGEAARSGVRAYYVSDTSPQTLEHLPVSQLFLREVKLR